MPVMDNRIIQGIKRETARLMERARAEKEKPMGQV